MKPAAQAFHRSSEDRAANALCVNILLATGTRKMELLGARWENVDLTQALWRIPTEDAKNGRDFDIPLPSRVVGWFVELQEMACGSPWVLPGRNPREPMNHSASGARASGHAATSGVGAHKPTTSNSPNPGATRSPLPPLIQRRRVCIRTSRG